MQQSERLLTPAEAAVYIGVSKSTLQAWRSQRPDLLPVVRLTARTIRYRIADLLSLKETRE